MKLTDKYILNLKHLDKDQFFSQEGVEGLTLRVYKYPSKAKTWFYQYRPKGKNSIRIKFIVMLFSLDNKNFSYIYHFWYHFYSDILDMV